MFCFVLFCFVLFCFISTIARDALCMLHLWWHWRDSDKIQLVFDIYQSDPKNSNNKSTYTRTSMTQLPTHKIIYICIYIYIYICIFIFIFIFLSFVQVLIICLVVGPPEYAKPPRTYNVDPNTQMMTIVPIQSVTGSVSGTTDVWFQLAYTSQAKYLSPFSLSPSLLPPLSLFPSLSLPLPLMQNVCKCCFVDKIRYKFTQDGESVTSKTLANAVKNMFHDQGFKYHSFVSLFLFYFILFYFFTFILLFLVCHFIHLDLTFFEVLVHQNWQDGVNHPTACAHVLAVQHVPSLQSSSPQHMYPLTSSSISSPILTSPAPSTFSLLAIYFKNAFISRDITTTSSIPQKAEFGISYPLPDTYDIDCCMFISNHIAFRNILAPGFKKSMNWDAYIVSLSLPLPLSFSSLQLWCKMRWKRQERAILIRSCSNCFQIYLFPSPPWVAFRFRTTPSPCRWALCLICSGRFRSIPPMRSWLPTRKESISDLILTSLFLFSFLLSFLLSFSLVMTWLRYDAQCSFVKYYDQEYYWQGSSQGTTRVKISFSDVPVTIDVQALNSSSLKLYPLILPLPLPSFSSLPLPSLPLPLSPSLPSLTSRIRYDLQSSSMTVNSEIRIDRDCCGAGVCKRGRGREGERKREGGWLLDGKRILIASFSQPTRRQHSSTVWIWLYYTILYYTILYYTILYYTILYYTILYYTILYCTILYYTVLYHKIKEIETKANQFTGNLTRYFPQAMAQAMNAVEFDSVSVLVLQGLLFPQSYMRVRSRRGWEGERNR